MDKKPCEVYELIYQKNLALLGLAQQGRWQDLIDLAPDYLVSLQIAITHHSKDLSEQDKVEIRNCIKRLIDNESIIMQAMKGRLETLRQDMSSLNLGKKCNLAYSSNFTSMIQ